MFTLKILRNKKPPKAIGGKEFYFLDFFVVFKLLNAETLMSDFLD